jgi:hypothetical protein
MSGRQHEVSDMPPRAILLALAGIFALIGFTGLGISALLHALSRPPALDALPAPPREGPALLVDQRAERLALEARGEARLRSYGWTDREAGLAHIPIDRAAALLVERGWPDPETRP